MEDKKNAELQNAPIAARFLLNGQFRFQTLQEATSLAQFFAAACPDPHTIEMGITEMLVNAVEHGNLGISSEEKAALQQQGTWLEEIERRLHLPQHLHQYVTVAFNKTDTEIQIKITDQGNGFDWQQYEHDSPLSTHGRGLLLAKKLAFKRVEYSKKGNEVTCVVGL